MDAGEERARFKERHGKSRVLLTHQMVCPASFTTVGMFVTTLSRSPFDFTTVAFLGTRNVKSRESETPEH